MGFKVEVNQFIPSLNQNGKLWKIIWPTVKNFMRSMISVFLTLFLMIRHCERLVH